ncbi:MAG TPA: RNA polymerase sigma factor [Acidimicrobiales bacterium]|jgi:RNA polymerase sigma-70 factor (ECF subfamily)|nr:RNA polymerase sigma factor [Acidimicrobiales bacterium]
MPENTDDPHGGIAPNANPSTASARIHDVWDASDEALVAGLALQDREAALVFVRRFQRRVYGCALAIVRDPGRAEDVAQEAFVRAWRHASVYDARRAGVATWLLTITRNLAIDAVRVEQVRPAEPVAMIDLMIDPAPEPSDVAVRSADVQRVVVALRQLPEEQRRCVLLASMHGRTAQEISHIENIPLGTAKTRLRTGLLKLRRELVPESSA